MRGFADQTFMDVWYTHVDIQSALAKFQSQIKAKRYKEAQKQLTKAHTSDSDKFDQAIADFAETYADQNERDYAALKTAAKEGKIEVSTEI